MNEISSAASDDDAYVQFRYEIPLYEPSAVGVWKADVSWPVGLITDQRV